LFAKRKQSPPVFRRAVVAGVGRGRALIVAAGRFR
jgi:hypothetical protein